MNINIISRVVYNDIKIWKNQLNTFGSVILRGLKPDEKSMFLLSDILERKIFKTDYGDIWDTSGQIGNATNDTAYSNIYLAPHTDLNYLPKTPKYQIFCCQKKAKEGGNTILVDGHMVYNIYKKNYSKYYKKLEEENYYFRCSEGKYEAKHKIYDNGIIHHNDSDMVPINNPEYKLWNGLINTYQTNFPLYDTETLIVDNHRILHGRKHFFGDRNMVGCYLE